MANKVAVIDSEYSKLESGLKSVHGDCIEAMESAINSVISLTAKGGAFEVDKINGVINSIVENLLSIKGQMRGAFDASEESIKSFQGVVEDNDQLC